jgi:hypothetical protein
MPPNKREDNARLRIVTDSPLPLQRARAGASDALMHDAAMAIAQSNQAAATGADELLRSLLGPRQIFAQAVEDCMQGGRAAIITPVDRDELLARAKQLGLRPFDAHLLIATVQDAARRGERAWISGGEPSQAPGMARQAVQKQAVQRQAAGETAAASSERARLPGKGHVAIEAVAAMQHAAQQTGVSGHVLIAVMLAMVMLASMIVIMGP